MASLATLLMRQEILSIEKNHLKAFLFPFWAKEQLKNNLTPAVGGKVGEKAVNLICIYDFDLLSFITPFDNKYLII